MNDSRESDNQMGSSFVRPLTASCSPHSFTFVVMFFFLRHHYILMHSSSSDGSDFVMTPRLAAHCASFDDSFIHDGRIAVPTLGPGNLSVRLANQTRRAQHKHSVVRRGRINATQATPRFPADRTFSAARMSSCDVGNSTFALRFRRIMCT